MENRIPLRFFAITLVWSWGFWAIPVLLNATGILAINDAYNAFDSPIGFVMMIIGAFGPMAGACVSLRTIEGKGAVKNYLKTFLSFNFGWKAWIAIFLFMGVIGFIAWIVPEFFGVERIQSYLPNVFIFLPYLIVMMFVGGGQEEIGWAGYMMPRLESRYGLVIGTIIRGIVWAIWHLPLWLLPGTSQSYMNFFAFAIMCMGFSFIFSWVIHISGNRPMSAIVTHGAANAFAALFPFLIMEDGANQIRMWIYAVVMLIVGIVVVALRLVAATFLSVNFPRESIGKFPYGW